MAPSPPPPCHRHHTPLATAPKALPKHLAAPLTQPERQPCSSCKAPQNLTQRLQPPPPPPATALHLHQLPPLHLHRTLGHPSSRGARPQPSPNARPFAYGGHSLLSSPATARKDDEQTQPEPCYRRARMAPHPGTQRASTSSTKTLSSLCLNPFLRPFFPILRTFRHRSWGSSIHQHGPCSSAYTQSHLFASRHRRRPQALAPPGGSPGSAK